jgi:hypothetical protein
MNLNELAATNTIELPQSAVVYGPPKAGKTALVCQLARKYKVLWLDVENGAQTIVSALPQEFWSNLNLIQIQDSQREPNAIKTIGRLFTKNANHVICEKHGVIGCIECTKDKASTQTLNLYDLDTNWVVAVDSLTQVADSAMAHSLGPVDEFDKKKIEFDHYDRQGLLIKNILTSFSRLRCHVVFISHEEELEQEDGSKKLCPVGGTRNFSRKVSRYFGHVVYCEVKNQKHRASSGTTAHNKVLTGSRTARELETGDSILDLFVAKQGAFEVIPTIRPPAAKPAGNAATNPVLAKLAQQGKTT